LNSELISFSGFVLFGVLLLNMKGFLQKKLFQAIIHKIAINLVKEKNFLDYI